MSTTIVCLIKTRRKSSTIHLLVAGSTTWASSRNMLQEHLGLAHRPTKIAKRRKQCFGKFDSQNHNKAKYRFSFFLGYIVTELAHWADSVFRSFYFFMIYFLNKRKHFMAYIPPPLTPEELKAGSHIIQREALIF